MRPRTVTHLPRRGAVTRLVRAASPAGRPGRGSVEECRSHAQQFMHGSYPAKCSITGLSGRHDEVKHRGKHLQRGSCER
jgi:hypothetical protein